MRIIIIFYFFALVNCLGQPLNYYQGAFALDSLNLKAYLHSLLEDHNEFDYQTVKTILRQTDQDPQYVNNVLLLYTGNTISKWNFANNPSSPSQQDYWNREHVWPKSHGDFGPDGLFTEKGANTDVHHLRAVDMTMNSLRGYKDFDEGGVVVYNGVSATNCKYTSNTWEPRDEVKGDIARMLFYMATRYEGGVSADGYSEPDLELINAISTFPNPWLGKLSSLLDWHAEDPVDEWEMKRNDIIYNWQGNRNPFIDHPEYVELIWGESIPSLIQIANVSLYPIVPTEDDSVLVQAQVLNPFSSLPDVVMYWGTSWNAVLEKENPVIMDLENGSNYMATIPNQLAGTKVYFRIEGSNGFLTDTVYVSHNFQIAQEPFSGLLQSIYEIQGQSEYSPLASEIIDATGVQYIDSNGQVSVAGIVTASIGDSFFMQEDTGAWSGIYVYQSGYFPQLGDSIIITGIIKEYYGLTELSSISAYYFISSGNELPVANSVLAGDIVNGTLTAEKYESTIVEVPLADCVEEVQDFGLWKIDDGTGELFVHNTEAYSYDLPIVGESYRVSGVLNYTYGEYKIDLRSSEDIGPGLDLISPYIISADIFVNGKLTLVFSEEISSLSVEVLENYNLDLGVEVVYAQADLVNASVVYLWLENLVSDSLLLKVVGCEDISGNEVVDSVKVYSPYMNLDLNSIVDFPLEVYSKDGKVYFNSLIPVYLESVFNVNGERLLNNRNTGSSSVSGLDRGVYFCVVKQGVNRKVVKVLIW